MIVNCHSTIPGVNITDGNILRLTMELVGGSTAKIKGLIVCS